MWEQRMEENTLYVHACIYASISSVSSVILLITWYSARFRLLPLWQEAKVQNHSDHVRPCRNLPWRSLDASHWRMDMNEEHRDEKGKCHKERNLGRLHVGVDKLVIGDMTQTRNKVGNNGRSKAVTNGIECVKVERKFNNCEEWDLNAFQGWSEKMVALHAAISWIRPGPDRRGCTRSDGNQQGKYLPCTVNNARKAMTNAVRGWEEMAQKEVE